MNRAVSTVLFSLGAFVLGFLVSSYAAHTWPFRSAAALSQSIEETKTKDAPVPAPATDTVVTLNGKNCPVTDKIDNPFVDGEELLVTSNGCYGGKSPFSIFLKTGDTVTELLPSDAYEHPFDNPYSYSKDEKIAAFFSADEIIYKSEYGEGAECTSGSQTYYNKLNIRTGEVGTAGKGGEGAHCHDVKVVTNNVSIDDACIDSGETYTFDTDTIKISVVCAKALKPSNQTISIKLNDKTLLEKSYGEGDEYSFPGIANTINLLKRNKNVDFYVGSTHYTLNLDTKTLSS